MEKRLQQANHKGKCECMMEILSILAALENYSVNTTSIEACGLSASAAGSLQVYYGGWPVRDFPEFRYHSDITLPSLFFSKSLPGLPSHTLW